MKDFDFDKETVERALNSQEFKNLYKNISENNTEISLLPEDQRRIVTLLYFLNREHLVYGLQEALYKIIPPSIDTFLTTREFVGSLYGWIYPKWNEVLRQVFADTSKVYEIILGGPIGGGKTTTALVIQLYNLIRVLCLRSPKETMGVPGSTVMLLQFISITLDKAGMALMNTFRNMLSECSLFELVENESDLRNFESSKKLPYFDEKYQINFSRSIYAQIGSRISHTLSFAVIGAILDEAEFRISGTDDAIEVYTSLKRRVTSRFLDSYNFTKLTLVSSARYTTGIIANHVSNLSPDDKSCKYYAFPIWEIKSFDYYKSGYFYAMRGTRTHPSKILDPEENIQYENGTFEVPSNCKVLKVPSVYRKDFQDNLDLALRDLAGEQTLGSEFLFDDLTTIEHEDLTPEVTIELRLGEKQDILKMLPASVFRSTASGRRLARYPNAPRYIHLDLAETAEAGIGIVHKELGDNGEIIVVADLVIHVTTKTRIDFDSIFEFVRDLKKLVGVNFYSITLDQFQSAYMLQRFRIEKLAPEEKMIAVQSVDKTTDPYRQFSTLVGSGLFHCGRSQILKHQLSHLSVQEGKVRTTDRKDVADGVCGAVFRALVMTKDVPINPRSIKKFSASQEQFQEI